MAAVSVNQSLLSPLKLEVDPNIQAVCTLEKEQFTTRNSKFASFIDKARNVEQQNEILETKWRLLQQRKTARSNVGNMFDGYIISFVWQLKVMAREKLKPEVELVHRQGLVEDFKNK